MYLALATSFEGTSRMYSKPNRIFISDFMHLDCWDGWWHGCYQMTQIATLGLGWIKINPSLLTSLCQPSSAEAHMMKVPFSAQLLSLTLNTSFLMFSSKWIIVCIGMKLCCHATLHEIAMARLGFAERFSACMHPSCYTVLIWH